jgi:hypothetical protein
MISNLCLFSAALGFEPDFLYPLENVTIAQGRDAMFTCVVNNLGGYRVSADLAPARVRALTLLSLSLSHSHSPWLSFSVCVSISVSIVYEFYRTISTQVHQLRYAFRTVTVNHRLYYFSFMKLISFAHMRRKVIVSSVRGLRQSRVYVRYSLSLLLIYIYY